MTLHVKIFVNSQLIVMGTVLIYGVWLTRVDAVAASTISEEFFLCKDHPMNKFELKFFQLIFFACF